MAQPNVHCHHVLPLTRAFADDLQKVRLWDAFTSRQALLLEPGDLGGAIEDIAAFLLQPLAAANAGNPFVRKWTAAGPWRTTRKRKS